MTVCPVICMSAGHWRPLHIWVPEEVDERLHPTRSWNLRAGWEPGKENQLCSTSPAGSSSTVLPPQVLQRIVPRDSHPEQRLWRKGRRSDGSPAEPCRQELGEAGRDREPEKGVRLPPLLWDDVLRYVQVCRREEPKALLCKGGGYLAQSREQLTRELSFSGFSCTREWVRPLPCL